MERSPKTGVWSLKKEAEPPEAENFITLRRRTGRAMLPGTGHAAGSTKNYRFIYGRYKTAGASSRLVVFIANALSLSAKYTEEWRDLWSNAVKLLVAGSMMCIIKSKP